MKQYKLDIYNKGNKSECRAAYATMENINNNTEERIMEWCKNSHYVYDNTCKLETVRDDLVILKADSGSWIMLIEIDFPLPKQYEIVEL